MRSLPARIAFGQKHGLSRAHAALLAKLRTPESIQDYVTSLPTNFELAGDTCLSVEETIRQNQAHCIEGAFVAAAALWLGGQPPLLMDFQAKGDDDHVVALFRHKGLWGAISKSNHVWLRWRDPIYRTLRELVLSYFHEYVMGPKKTLRRYSVPFDLSRHHPSLWLTGKEQCFEMAERLDAIRHIPIMPDHALKRLRPRDAMEIKAGKLVEYAAPDAATAMRY